LRDRVVPFVPPIRYYAWEAVGRNSGDILNLDILLGAGKDVPYFGDFMLYQVLIK